MAENKVMYGLKNVHYSKRSHRPQILKQARSLSLTVLLRLYRELSTFLLIRQVLLSSSPLITQLTTQ